MFFGRFVKHGNQIRDTKREMRILGNNKKDPQEKKYKVENKQSLETTSVFSLSDQV